MIEAFKKKISAVLIAFLIIVLVFAIVLAMVAI